MLLISVQWRLTSDVLNPFSFVHFARLIQPSAYPSTAFDTSTADYPCSVQMQYHFEKQRNLISAITSQSHLLENKISL